ncbi:transcriptional regulator FtrA [Paracraurococcus ruber]|uniref:Transcriptional regulator FtrA n=2 Tax=Paracraurococcus ruber TaxID=77675 RepID=A0ABS1D8C1_9PROT|nr:transcriptional regulator FtrA [Paracraurococcus ruber]MBK1662482.1 transcriptional regulator FtrA [Paracraurococcus ruber]TDG27545.1 transcriptional regulator FtrA [Paracraurococcus ruber]
MPNPPANRLVVALAYDGLCTFEFGVAVEVFGLERPEMGPGWYRFAVAALEPSPLRAAGGVRVMADGGAALLAAAGTILVPGWRGAAEPVPPAIAAALRAAHDRGARVLSLCSGVFVLAAAGLLEGRRATTHWRYLDALRAAHPGITLVPDVLYVDEGSVLTAAGSAAGIDLCLHLVRRDFGPAAANSVARRLVVPPHREGGQAQFIPRPVPVEREGVRLGPLLDRMRARLDAPQPLEALAREAGMSLRTFIRRFRETTGMPPGEWLLRQRLDRARELLEQGQGALEDVAASVGFGSAAVLRLHFRRRFGTSPGAYRARFAG